MKNLKTVIMSLPLITMCNFAFADDTSRGCGLGTLATPQKTLISTSTANIIDNFSFPSQQFATTSGTSGCARHSLVLNQKIKEHFIESNFDQIRIESAIGSGETIVVLARTYGCNQTGTVALGLQLQSQYEKFAQQNTETFIMSLNELVKENEILKNDCSSAV